MAVPRVTPSLRSAVATGMRCDHSRARPSDGGSTASQTVTLGLNEPLPNHSLEDAMRSSLFTFLFAVVAPLALGSSACFLSTEGDTYEGTFDSGGCEIGSEGCACTSGGKCNDPFSCNVNLGICVADTCPVGTEACACTPEGSCDPGLLCASDICVDAGCSAGTEGCQCTEGGGCDPGLACLSGLCVDPNTSDDTTGSHSDDDGTTSSVDGTTTGDVSETTSGGTGQSMPIAGSFHITLRSCSGA